MGGGLLRKGKFLHSKNVGTIVPLQVLVYVCVCVGGGGGCRGVLCAWCVRSCVRSCARACVRACVCVLKKKKKESFVSLENSPELTAGFFHLITRLLWMP